MKQSIYFFISLLVIFTSCKTREDIAREQQVDAISSQMIDSQKLNADFTVRLQTLEERLSTVTGQVEEQQHNSKKDIEKRITGIEERLSLIEGIQKTQTDSIENLEKELQSQKKYIDEVLSTLKGIAKKSSKKKSKLSLFDEAMKNYAAGKYQTAKPQLLKLLSQKSIKNSQKARIIHNLGMIAYSKKKNEEALTYFSRVFTEYPKSGYNKNGLYHLAKTFQRMKKKEEAKQTLNELIKRWPSSKRGKMAKSLLKEL